MIDGWKLIALDDGWFAKLAAGRSREQWLQKRDQLMDEYGDESTIIHEMDNGWRIHKLPTEHPNSYYYEGNMMDNCVGSGHAGEKGVYSLRDSDNIPYISFGIKTNPDTQCERCHGHGWHYNDEGDDVHCTECNGYGRVEPEGDEDKVSDYLELRDTLGRSDTQPDDEVIMHLMKGLREHFEPKGAKGVTFTGGLGHQGQRTWDEIEDASRRVREEQERPNDVYMAMHSMMKNEVTDEDGSLNFNKIDYTHPSQDRWLKLNSKPFSEDEQEDLTKRGFHILKTPLSSRRFDISSGLSEFITSGKELPSTPNFGVKWNRASNWAVFPKTTFQTVASPHFPTKIHFTTPRGYRENKEVFTPTGFNTGGVTRGDLVGELDLPNTAQSDEDVWSFEGSEEEMQEHLTYGHYGDLTWSGKNLPYDRMKLVKKGEGDGPELPQFESHEECEGKGCDNCANGLTPKWKQPDYVHATIPLDYHTSYQDIHDFLDGKPLKKEGLPLHIRSHPEEHPSRGYNHARIKIKNDPEYLEETGFGSLRTWQLKKDLPRTHVEVTSLPEPPEDVDLKEHLAPEFGYLHIPRHYRSDDTVYGSRGIRFDNYNMRLHKDEESGDSYALPPTTTDTFKVRLSQIPGLKVNTGSFEVPFHDETGEQTIPWEAVESLHRRATQEPAEELKKRNLFAASRLRLLADGWGDVNWENTAIKRRYQDKL